MMSDDPAFLTVGTEVSAKFKGAFCEAKIKKVNKSVRCKIQLKEHPFGVIAVEHQHIKSETLELNQQVDIQQGKSTVKGTIQHIKDCSTYHVVFNDGDEKTLRRTQMCLKGGRHFDEKVSLDSLPLYNPEQWINNPDLTKTVEIMPKEMVKKLKRKKTDDASTSQKKKKKKEEEETDDEGSKKREKRAAASAASVAIEEMDQGDTEVSCDGSSSGDASDVEKEREKDRKKQEMEKREKSVNKSPEDKNVKFDDGDVICFYEDESAKSKWIPGVVVSRKVYRSTPKAAVLLKKDTPIRLFTNGRYYKTPSSQLSLLKDQKVGKKFMEGLPTNMKTAMERAIAFYEKDTLPGNWKMSELFDEDKPTTSKEKEPKEGKKKEKEKKEDKEKKKEKKVESESSSSEESEDEASGEERDLFVAQLYKFQEDRGTPINRAPVLGGKDIDLYRFYQVVQNYGGAKRVTANSEWKKVMQKLKLEGCPGATPVTVRKAYARYLAHFNTFYKALGAAWTQSSSSSGRVAAASPRDRRVLLRGPVDDKKMQRRKSTTEKDKKKEGDKESTVEKESSEESKDDKEKKKEEKKTPEKAKEMKIEKIERSASISEKDKKDVKETLTKAKEEEKKKEPEKKKQEEKKKTEKERKNSESVAETLDAAGPSTTAPIVVPKSPRKIAATWDVVQPEDFEGEDEDGGPFRVRKPKGYDDDADPSVWLAADIFVFFFLGMRVRAWHHGRWYEARVVNFSQLDRREMLTFLQKFEHSTTCWLPDECVRYVNRHIQDTRIFVHYLGWNSRYDENVNLAKLKIDVKDMDTSLAYYRIGSITGDYLNEPFLKKLLAYVRGPQGIGSLKREHTKGAGLGGGYRPRRITREKYEQILAAELKIAPPPPPPLAAVPKEESPEPGTSAAPATPATILPPPIPAQSSGSSQPEPSAAADTKAKERDSESPFKIYKASRPAPPPRSAYASVSARIVIPPKSEQKKEKEPEPHVEATVKTPKDPSPVASPRPKRQRTISATSNRTASPAVFPTPPPPSTPTPTPIPVAASPISPQKNAEIIAIAIAPTQKTAPAEADPLLLGVSSEKDDGKKKSQATKSLKKMEKPKHELNDVSTKLVVPPKMSKVVEEKKQEEETKAVEQKKEESKPAELSVKPVAEKKEEPGKEEIKKEEKEANDEAEAEQEEEDEEDEEEEEEGDDELEEEETAVVKEEPAKPMPRRVPIMGRESMLFQSTDQGENKRKRKESQSLDETKEEVEEDEEEDEEEEEELDQLEEEAKNVMNATRDEDSDTGSESPPFPREEGEEEAETTEEPSTPGIMSPGRRGGKRKRLSNSRHSQMVVDKKYIKHKPKEKLTEESEDDEDESAFNRESYVKRKNNMYKTLEADNKLDDCSSLGIECITKLMLNEGKVIPTYEAHLLKLREMYASARQEIHLLERQRRAQEDRKRESRDRERQLKESISSPSQSSSSTLTADST